MLDVLVKLYFSPFFSIICLLGKQKCLKKHYLYKNIIFKFGKDEKNKT